MRERERAYERGGKQKREEEYVCASVRERVCVRVCMRVEKERKRKKSETDSVQPAREPTNILQHTAADCSRL